VTRSLAAVAHKGGNYIKAIEQAEKALQAYKEMKLTSEIIVCLCLLAESKFEVGHTRSAKLHLVEAEELQTQCKNIDGKIYLNRLKIEYIFPEDISCACTEEEKTMVEQQLDLVMKTALNFVEETHNSQKMKPRIESLYLLGKVYKTRNKLIEASNTLKRALKLAREHGYKQLLQQIKKEKDSLK